MKRYSPFRCVATVTFALLCMAFVGCSSEPVVIEATPDQQQIFADEYAAEMQSRG